MATASSTDYVNGLAIRVEVQARAENLSDDASRASEAAAMAMRTIALPRPIAELREEYRAACEGEIDTDCTDTYYGRLVSFLTDKADVSATKGWHNPDAFVTVDVDAG